MKNEPETPFEIPETRIVDGQFHSTGVSGTTQIYLHERSDKERTMDLKPGDMRRPLFEVRMGIAFFGCSQNEDGPENPFHPEFYDNFASGEGNTEDEAMAALAANVDSTADTLWI